MAVGNYPYTWDPTMWGQASSDDHNVHLGLASENDYLFQRHLDVDDYIRRSREFLEQNADKDYEALRKALADHHKPAALDTPLDVESVEEGEKVIHKSFSEIMRDE